jgi:tRNA wybutosine-synthesizing protein 2
MAWEKHTDLILLPAGSFSSAVWTEIIPQADKEALFKEILSIIGGGAAWLARRRSGAAAHGGKRLPNVEVLFDQRKSGNTWAKRVENGITYTWDITRCMFSVGNITEKLRVAKFNCQNEVVVDLVR